MGAKSGALASSAVCQQPVVQGPVEVSVIPRWSGVDAGHIIEDGGYPPTVVAAPGRRVVASGDFHGDMRAARRALQLAGVLSQDQQDRWTGGSSVFVQVGDVLDRGDDEIAIMSLLAHLSRQASAAGGALYQVCGNHETMNVYGDFRYVTEEGFKEGDWFDRWARENYGGDHMAAFQSWYKEAPLAKQQLKRSPSASWNPLLANRPRRVRQELFEPGGPLARVMAGYSAVLQVNDSLFAHGGVLPHHVDYGLERLNREVSRWMLGHTDRVTGEPQEQPFLATRGYNSVMWSRLYSREEYDSGAERDQVCMTLSKALRMVPGAKRLIVGHTPQETGANSECNGRIWRIDVGMSSGILQAAPQVLEISGSDVRVLSEETGRDLWLASYI
ncbi:hypothetical protein KFL_003920100 [Klebsormidium nitens]|uniref:Calcineurin-like phosphoesterase domain-containing protein n=1 Tax=Klebsormidium nitens TaxID=105231 RepID=A0A1Y1IFV4_KLENI|nr:hypothetical protein KFL_003920100 [Klebsormidium nitens]|eukprot:GAQ87991.1 hypothetical protein KFL_003920100 [Klebsormidium nitens]